MDLSLAKHREAGPSRTNDRKPHITLEPLEHRNEHHVAIRGTAGPAYGLMRKFPNIRFSRTHSCWYFPHSNDIIERFKAHMSDSVVIGDQATTTYIKLISDADDQLLPSEYHDMLVRTRYSDSTRENYVSQLRAFVKWIQPATLETIDEALIHQYMFYLVNVRRVSISTQNQAINAIKFYLEKVMKGDRKVYYAERPRKEYKLPKVLSQGEVVRVFENTPNLKHRCMLMILYSAGLRISELLNLRPEDIDADRNLIHVRGAKGKKDRYTLLSMFAFETLKIYRASYWTKTYLFEGPGSAKYSARSVDKIIKRSASAAGIIKRVSAHTLRHSFATHLLENGYDIRYIQALVGHNSIRTTERYAHVTTAGMDKIQSPLDSLAQKYNFTDSTKFLSSQKEKDDRGV